MVYFLNNQEVLAAVTGWRSGFGAPPCNQRVALGSGKACMLLYRAVVAKGAAAI